MDDICAAAVWIGSRGAANVITRQPTAELVLGADAFDRAARDIERAILAKDTCEPLTDLQVRNLLWGAEACVRVGDIPPKWLTILTELIGRAHWKPHIYPREAVRQCWPRIERVVGELLYTKFVLVSRVAELCNVKDFA
jgi:hypothetical protein